MATKGIRIIGGKEFMLCGRTSNRKCAEAEKAALLKSWEIVKIIKLWDYDFMLYVHGGR